LRRSPRTSSTSTSEPTSSPHPRSGLGASAVGSPLVALGTIAPMHAVGIRSPSSSASRSDRSTNSWACCLPPQPASCPSHSATSSPRSTRPSGKCAPLDHSTIRLRPNDRRALRNGASRRHRAQPRPTVAARSVHFRPNGDERWSATAASSYALARPPTCAVCGVCLRSARARVRV
jgi:hypothetical protein